jgi:hypothetical protein
MPDITATITLNQAQRISASFGPKPAELTHEAWIVQNTKFLWKQRVKASEAQIAGNTAHDAAIAQAELDFGGF